MDSFQNGMDSINGSFGARTLSLSANSINAVGSINGSAFGRNSNQDVISAIDRLGRAVNNMPRNNYTVNGLTYDDGSNIHQAIDTLIRATIVEGRA